MDTQEDYIYYSDDEEMYWSESDCEYNYGRPICMGCQCQHKSCENQMPQIGSVLVGSTEWDVQDYIDLNIRLLKIGVRLDYQCLRCQQCQDCIAGPSLQVYPSVLILSHKTEEGL